MTQPFKGIRVLDLTHVIAGPFAGYQLGVLGADVIKIEDPLFPDQSRELGADAAANRARMGAGFLAQASNKRSMTLNLKTVQGRAILLKLAASADVLVENYRPGALARLGLGHEKLQAENPRLIYCSISAFGQAGPRGDETAYDHVIQASCGMMSATGTKEVHPLRVGAPVIDYATGTMAAFALASALFQRETTGKGQYIDLAMFDVALVLQSYLATGYLRSGIEPQPKGNEYPAATNSAYPTRDGLIMLGGSNLRQQRRLWDALGRPDMAKSTNEARDADRAREARVLEELMLTRSADEWETFFRGHHVPAARVRRLSEALADPHVEERGIFHEHPRVGGIEGPVKVTVTGFKMAHGGPRISTPPAQIGQHNDELLGELGYGPEDIDRFRREHVI